jgi:hypothetical protein
VGDLAHRGGDLVGGVVVQQPPEQRVKLRLGKTTVTPTPGSAASSLTSSAAARSSRRSGLSISRA